MSCVYFKSEEVKDLFVDFIEKRDDDPSIHVDEKDVNTIGGAVIGINIHNLSKLETKEILEKFEEEYHYSWVLRVDEDRAFYTIGYFSSDGNYFPNHHTCNKYGIPVDRSGYFYDPKFDNGKYIEEESSWSYITGNFEIHAWEEI